MEFIQQLPSPFLSFVALAIVISCFAWENIIVGKQKKLEKEFKANLSRDASKLDDRIYENHLREWKIPCPNCGTRMVLRERRWYDWKEIEHKSTSQGEGRGETYYTKQDYVDISNSQFCPKCHHEIVSDVNSSHCRSDPSGYPLRTPIYIPINFEHRNNWLYSRSLREAEERVRENYAPLEEQIKELRKKTSLLLWPIMICMFYLIISSCSVAFNQ